MGPGQVVAAGPKSLQDLSALVFCCSKNVFGDGVCPDVRGTGTAGKPAFQRHREWRVCVCHVLDPCQSPVGKWLSSISKPLTAMFYFISPNGKGFPCSETFF